MFLGVNMLSSSNFPGLNFYLSLCAPYFTPTILGERILTILRKILRQPSFKRNEIRRRKKALRLYATDLWRNVRRFHYGPAAFVKQLKTTRGKVDGRAGGCYGDLHRSMNPDSKIVGKLE